MGCKENGIECATAWVGRFWSEFFPWLVVESDIRRQSFRRQLEKKVEKAEQEGQKKLRELSAQKFACGPDALAAAQTLSKQLNYHNLTAIKI